MIDPSPENPAPNPVRNACRLTLASRLWRFFLPISLVFGFFGPAAAQAFRPSTTDFAPNSAPSWRHGWAFASGTGDGSARLWNVADAAIAAGVSSALRSGEPDPPRLVALVIANGAYPDAPLQNPVIDAGLVGESLKRIGFAVTLKTNVDLDGFEQALSDFAEASKGADVALFYFAGHGFSVAADGIQQNLLMTTSSNFQAKSEIALRQGGEPLDHVEETIIGRARATLIFIDACRNVPALAHRGISSRGFAPLNPSSTEGAYVVLSTRQGKTAEDGEVGQGSPFARAFAATLPTAGLRIEDAAARIRKKVREETSDAQDPDVVRSDLPEGGVVLMPTGGSPSTPVAVLEFDPANGCSDGRFGVKGDRLPGSDSAGGVEIRAAAARGRTARFRDDSRRPRAKDRSE